MVKQKMIDELEHYKTKLIEIADMPEEKSREILFLLNGLKARVNSITPEITRLYDNAVGNFAIQYADRYTKINYSLLKLIIDKEVADYKYLVTLCDRLNSIIESVSRNTISILSDIKEERRAIP